ncbi:BlaI/MecI/CopY family transcriptional regulator [Catellatospora sp. TT07R-123]|uniref:BlaI/MecI/CopY family transcriptional regulator n=1 Tax=Catellatospora sp. TT07R-123 TaxID=2733863 RepID=UPI001BB3E13E|nr:BlaI/MecI/CopY family transcriptional regulator [Catellatospora sp. TT07R-123]
MNSPPKRRGAGQLEHEVLAVLWAAAQPLTPAEVATQLDSGLAYNTVHTILTRLQEKGQIRREVIEGRARYSPVQDAAAAAAGQMRAVLDNTSDDRAVVLARFVTDLDPADEAALRDALDRRHRR